MDKFDDFVFDGTARQLIDLFNSDPVWQNRQIISVRGPLVNLGKGWYVSWRESGIPAQFEARVSEIVNDMVEVNEHTIVLKLPSGHTRFNISKDDNIQRVGDHMKAVARLAAIRILNLPH